VQNSDAEPATAFSFKRGKVLTQGAERIGPA